MKLLHLATDAYGGHGGIALYNRDFLGALAADPRVDEIVVLPRVIHRDPGPLPEKVRHVTGAASGKLAYGAAVARAAAGGGPFDAVICAHINLLPFASLLRQPPALMIYGIEAWQPRRVPKLRAVLAISEITLGRFRRWSHSDAPAFLLPNAIDLSLYSIRPRNEALVERYGLRGKRVLLTVGRVLAAESYKGFDEVIEVLPQLDGDVVYLIAGGGDDLERLRAKAAALRVGERVIFTGLFSEAEKADLYNLADVYVMPSRGEGFGFVLLEALASGVPVIGSKHDGAREALRGGELGALIDPSNPAELRVAIRDALADRQRRVPDGLRYFDVPEFRRRVHGFIDALERPA